MNQAKLDGEEERNIYIEYDILIIGKHPVKTRAFLKNALNDTAYTRWSCQSDLANRCANCVDPSRLTVFGKPAF